MKALIFIFLATLTLACKTKSPVIERCSTVGTVKNYAGLDGCGMLIVMENGDLLNPAVLPENVVLIDGQDIAFSYRELKGRMSNCMAEKKIIEITCFQIIEKPEEESICTNTNNPFAIDWMDEAIDRHNPTQVIKYRDGEEFLYLYNAIPVSYLYNCYGVLLCETRNSHDDCHQEYISKYGKGTVIWEGEGVWD